MAYKKPSSVTTSATSGRYSGSGVNYTVKGTTNYYVYIQDPTTRKYWKKGQITSTSGLTVNLGASDTTSSSYDTYVVLSSTDLGDSCTIGNEYSSYLYAVSVPLYICRIYKGTSTINTYNNLDHPTLTTPLARSDYETIVGLTTTVNSKTKSYNATWSSSLNGKTLYTIYSNPETSESETRYYYRGSSSQYTIDYEIYYSASYLYGTGTKSGGEVSKTYLGTTSGGIASSHASDSNYEFQGWSTSASSKTVSYGSPTGNALSAAKSAYDDGYTTIYGVYKASLIEKQTPYTYYRGSNSANTVYKTTQEKNSYYYGKGTYRKGTISYSYDSINENCQSNSSYILKGWAISASTSWDYEDAWDAFNAGNTTIYGVFEKTTADQNTNYTYYRGSSTPQTVVKTIKTNPSYYYGKGSHSVGTSSTSYGTITSDCAVSGWTFIGFTPNINTQSSTSTAIDLFNAGNTTIYGTYNKTDTMTYYPQNGDSSNSVSATNYRYGTGSVTSNVPTEPSLTYDGYTFLGWATTSEGTSDTWNNQYNNGTRTVYAIWEKDGNVYIGVNGQWILVETYIGDNGVWKPLEMKYGTNEMWKPN